MSFPSPRRLLSGLLSKPPKVILFRMRQEARAAFLKATGGFARLDKQANRSFDTAIVEQFQQKVTAGNGALLSQAAVTAALAGDAPEGLVHAAKSIALEIRSQGIELFGRRHPIVLPYDWSKDPVYGHVWPAGYFRMHNHYGARSVPFDVKRAWEFGRLAALPLLLSGAVLARDAELAKLAGDVLADFESANPLGWSVQWYPMEASMRTANLALAAELAAIACQQGLIDKGQLRPYLVALWRNAAFVDLFTEYTDVRGNHYAANIVALTLAGTVLPAQAARASNWAKNARALDEEICSQFLPDGVNFEKSLPYHRLVCELFLLGTLATQRVSGHGGTISSEAKHRLARAVNVLSRCERPDGLSPNLGDNDDAKAISLDLRRPRWCAPVVALGLAMLEQDLLSSDMPASRDADFQRLEPADCLAAWWIGGSILTGKGHSIEPTSFVQHFQEGGYVAAKKSHGWFFCDVGEVGMNGRGGHGHNDLLSFEFGSPAGMFVIDSGAPIYTGDRAKRDKYRSSIAHNGLTIDDEEIAPFEGFWRIRADAEPENVLVSEVTGGLVIRAGHRGYQRLGASHNRQWHLHTDGSVLTIEDEVETSMPRRIARRLHLAPGWACTAQTKSSKGMVLRFAKDTARATITIEDGSTFLLEDIFVSEGYDQESESQRVVISSHGTKKWRGRITIALEK